MVETFVLVVLSFVSSRVPCVCWVKNLKFGDFQAKKVIGCQKGLNTAMNGSDTLTQIRKACKPKKADQPDKPLAPWRHLSRLRERNEAIEEESASDILSPLPTIQLSDAPLYSSFLSFLYATVHSAKPNKGQVPSS